MSASNLTFALRISAQDQTRTGLRSALSGLQSFARTAIKPITVPLKLGMAGVRALRDFNLGLRPLIAGMDDLIERGAALEVQQKSFAALTGTRGAATQRLAGTIQRAAAGTIRLAEAMQIANRALGSGLNMQQLVTAIDFISKKSITTGRSAREALDKVITGLARGSTLFLDDFGILVDGIDGVRTAFDRIRGAGAFDQLGPAAQKAEIIRAAIAEMAGQMTRMGVTGRETIFVWSQIKNQVGDATDKLILAIAKSRAMREALRGLRDLLGGLEKHFAGGGGFGQLLFGKEGKGGALRVLGAGLVDLGENLGRAVGGGLLKALGGGLDLLTGGLVPVLREWARTFADELGTRLRAMLDDLAGKARALFTIGGGMPAALSGVIAPKARAAGTAARFLFNPFNPDNMAQQMLRPFGIGRRPARPAPYNIVLPGGVGAGAGFGAAAPTLGQRIAGLGDSLLGGMGFERTRAAAGEFMGQFGSGQTAADQARARAMAYAAAQQGGGLRLTRFARERQQRIISANERRLRTIAGGGEFVRQSALREAGMEAEALRRAGFRVTPSVRRDLIQQALRRQIEARSSGPREAIEGARGVLRGDAAAGQIGAAAARLRRERDTGKQDRLIDSITELGRRIDAMISALVGGSERVARAGA